MTTLAERLAMESDVDLRAGLLILIDAAGEEVCGLVEGCSRPLCKVYADLVAKYPEMVDEGRDEGGTL